MRAHINIGSNIGDRHGHLQSAVAALYALACEAGKDPCEAGEDPCEAGKDACEVGEDPCEAGGGGADPCFRKSAEVESAPWGYESDNAYLNCAVSFETSLPPFELLDRLQRIEREISASPHRDTSGRYIDRVIDIDLILLGDTRISTPRLTLPHPRAHLRPFVTGPLREIDPDLLPLLPQA